MVCHESLEEYYKANFNLQKKHGYSLSELESMLPWEREVYVNMLITYLKEEKMRLEQQ